MHAATGTRTWNAASRVHAIFKYKPDEIQVGSIVIDITDPVGSLVEIVPHTGHHQIVGGPYTFQRDFDATGTSKVEVPGHSSVRTLSIHAQRSKVEFYTLPITQMEDACRKL